MNCNKSTPITIKKIVNEGYGLARLNDGKTVLIRHGLPGETVIIDTIEKQQKLDYAKVTEVVSSHPNRIDPPCPYYKSCGGCDLQHADYRLQCSIKQEILQDLLKRSSTASVKKLADQVLPILQSNLELGYRQRIKLKVKDRYSIGFNRFRSHDIVPIKRCLLAPNIINDCLSTIRDSSSFEKIADITEEINIQRNPSNETICVLLHLIRKIRPAERKTIHSLAGEIGPETRIFLSGNQFAVEGPFCSDKKNSDNTLSFNLSGPTPLALSWEAGGFCQVNLDQNLQLIKLVIQFCNPSSTDQLLDLYCGMGNFSLPLAGLVGFVHGIESQGASIRSAKRNSRANNITNTEFTKSDVLTACEKLVQAKAEFDAVICDPPRQGLVNMAPLLAKLSKGRIIYISCNPATLCRDLGALTSEGFGVKAIQPVDMFPQTHHIETVTLLEKD